MNGCGKWTRHFKKKLQRKDTGCYENITHMKISEVLMIVTQGSTPACDNLGYVGEEARGTFRSKVMLIVKYATIIALKFQPLLLHMQKFVELKKCMSVWL